MNYKGTLHTLSHSSFFYTVLYIHHIEFHEFDVLNRAALLSLPVYHTIFCCTKLQCIAIGFTQQCILNPPTLKSAHALRNLSALLQVGFKVEPYM